MISPVIQLVVRGALLYVGFRTAEAASKKVIHATAKHMDKKKAEREKQEKALTFYDTYNGWEFTKPRPVYAIPNNRTLQQQYPYAEIGFSPTRAAAVSPRLSDSEKLTIAVEEVRQLAHAEVDATVRDIVQSLNNDEEKDIESIKEEIATQFVKTARAREKARKTEEKVANA